MKPIFILFLAFLLSIFLLGCNTSSSIRPTIVYKPQEKPILQGDNQEYELIKFEEFTLPYHLHKRGIEGYVVVEFSIDENGRTFNHKIIESEQGAIFGPLAIDNISRHEYRPRVVEGKKVEVHGVKQKLTFCWPELYEKENFIFENKSKECAVK